MRQLILLRHAKSSWDDPRLPDRERPLSARGVRSAVLVQRALRERGLTPDLILASPARRVQQTLEALEPWDEMPLIDTHEALYLASAQQLYTVLHGVAETVRSVLLIAHNPGLQELAVSLMGASADLDPQAPLRRMTEAFPTAAIAEFTIPGPWWQLAPGGGRLLHFTTPRDLEVMRQ
jgi:phosphohistidine phosphatase